jgi:hypothetical protein
VSGIIQLPGIRFRVSGFRFQVSGKGNIKAETLVIVIYDLKLFLQHSNTPTPPNMFTGKAVEL